MASAMSASSSINNARRRVSGGTTASRSPLACTLPSPAVTAAILRESVVTCPASRPPARTSSGQMVMANVLRLDHENHVLGDIRRVVGDAFQVATDQDERQRVRNGLRIRHHGRNELAEELVLEAIDLVV